MAGRSTTDAIFVLRMLIKKYREGQETSHCVFINLEKAYVRVSRQELWHCMIEGEISEAYVRAVRICTICVKKL
jgi:hypothetical protein